MQDLIQRILITGIPASGKSTQAGLLRFRRIRVRDLRKSNCQTSFSFYTSLSNDMKIRLKELISNPEETAKQTSGIYRNLSKYKFFNNYVLDGVLFDITDAKYLLKKDLINKVIVLNLGEEEARKRAEFIREHHFEIEYSNLYFNKRIQIFKENTLPAINYLREKSSENLSLIEIDASKSKEEISKEISSFLN